MSTLVTAARALAEATAALWYATWVIVLAGFLPAAVRATDIAALYWLFYGGFAAHLALCFQQYARGRWSFDVWLGAGLVAAFVVVQFAANGWPLSNEGGGSRFWGALAGGEANVVLLPYLHALLWWAGVAAVRRVVSGSDER